jgi:hypothetical protein
MFSAGMLTSGIPHLLFILFILWAFRAKWAHSCVGGSPESSGWPGRWGMGGEECLKREVQKGVGERGEVKG